MTPTDDDLRNEIRRAVGRDERIESTAFAKEDLDAICATVDAGVDTEPMPPRSRMRAGIRRRVDAPEDGDPERAERPFRKAELEAIAAALGER